MSFNLPDLSQSLNKTAMIIHFHLSQQENHQLCWSDLPLPAKEEIHLEYVTHPQRKYNLDYLDDDFVGGHYTVLSWFLLMYYALIFHFDAQLSCLIGNFCQLKPVNPCPENFLPLFSSPQWLFSAHVSATLTLRQTSSTFLISLLLLLNII